MGYAIAQPIQMVELPKSAAEDLVWAQKEHKELGDDITKNLMAELTLLYMGPVFVDHFFKHVKMAHKLGIYSGHVPCEYSKLYL
jgi:hypothetical protein